MQIFLKICFVFIFNFSASFRFVPFFVVVVVFWYISEKLVPQHTIFFLFRLNRKQEKIKTNIKIKTTIKRRKNHNSLDFDVLWLMVDG